MSEPTGRFSVAFDDPTLTWVADWTRIDDPDLYPNLVTSYTIDRGRQFETDRTDTGRAVVQIADVHGILDPTNSAGPFYGKLEPLKQAAIARWNPVSDDWWTRYRGFIEGYSYSFDPSQRVNVLTVSLVDFFEILASIEMLPGSFGISTVGTTAAGQVGFAIQTMQQRIFDVLGDAGIPSDFYVIFSGNVEVHATTYSPSESALSAVQEAVDAEFPWVANSYVDRLGRFCVHGRLARFDPVGTAASPEGAAWDFNQWKAGDGTHVAASSGTMAQIRRFAFDRGLAKVVNSAIATPMFIADADMPNGSPILLGGTIYADGPHVYDSASIGLYGIRSWSAQNLLTRRGLLDDSDDLTETRRFSEWIVQNFGSPKNRVTDIAFRSLRPTDPRAGALWSLLSKIDVSDLIEISVDAPGGGGFNLEPFFVEGVHEIVRPLNANYDDVTLSLDLSPQTYFQTDPWPD